MDGAVTSSTPSVQYSYSDDGVGGVPRLTSITYPDGYTVNYNYASGVDNTISRLSSISDYTGTLQSYTYMGLDTVVDQDDSQVSVALNYVNSMSTGDAGDEVVGLDRYGRVVNQNWEAGSTAIVEYQYTYDEDGNVLSKTDATHTSFNQAYTYNSLNELTSFTETGEAQSGSWAYDALGNMTEVTTNGTSQARTANAQNEYTSISGETAPGYDADGNMTKDQNGLYYVYDAWNRLVDVYNSSSETSAHLVESMTYDGMGRLVTDTAYSGDSSTTTNRYYSSEDQVLEEQAGSAYTNRYVWSPVYVNAMVLRDSATSSSGLTSTGGDYARLYELQDADYNVVALVNTSGSIVENYDYTPFGAQTIYNSAYSAIGSTAYGWVYGFQGMRFDSITGLNEADMRWYSPALERWTANDPMGFAGGQANLYGEEGNNPVDQTDPTGLMVEGYGSTPQERLDNANALISFIYQTYANLINQGVDYDVQVNETTGAINFSAADQQVIQALLDNAAKLGLSAGMQDLLQAALSNATWRYVRSVDGVLQSSGIVRQWGPFSVNLDAQEGYTPVLSNAGDAVRGAMNGDSATYVGRATLAGAEPIIAVLGVQYGWAAARAAAAGAAGACRNTLNSNNCFPANTSVAAEHGQKPIQEITSDDKVWAFDLVAGEWKLRHVIETYKHEHKGNIVEVSIHGEEIKSTEHHPWWVVQGEALSQRPKPEHVPDNPVNFLGEGRWVDAIDLRVGDILLLRSGEQLPITRLIVRHTHEQVYNFQVEEFHCYAVGNSQVLVHNNSKLDLILEEMEGIIGAIEQHGDPSTWRFVGVKDSVPARLGSGQKVYEIWKNASGRLFEIHYFLADDGVTITGSTVKPYSP